MFLFRLAATLGMTVAELCERMDSRELSEWMAVHRFFVPLPDSWQQTALLASATLAPYAKKGHPPKPGDFIPVEKPPQHQEQINAMIRELSRQLRGS